MEIAKSSTTERANLLEQLGGILCMMEAKNISLQKQKI
jgi:hypothetical protein